MLIRWNWNDVHFLKHRSAYVVEQFEIAEHSSSAVALLLCCALLHVLALLHQDCLAETAMPCCTEGLCCQATTLQPVGVNVNSLLINVSRSQDPLLKWRRRLSPTTLKKEKCISIQMQLGQSFIARSKEYTTYIKHSSSFGGLDIFPCKS